jgi:hypothetical protein
MVSQSASPHALGDVKVPRTHTVSLKLSADEHEWLRRKAHWEGQSMAALLRHHLHYLIAEEGYLRPPDDEPQDFGSEKELMQFVVSIQKAGE